jgi:taurine dioxygenase
MKQKYKLSPTTGSLGAILEGVDLTLLDKETLNLLVKALDQFLVIQIPNQNLDRFQLSKLGSAFGPHFHHPIVSNGYEDCPEVLELLKRPEDIKVFGGESWHADITWLKPGGYLSFLHGIEIPKVGGDTAFSSTISAFEKLSNSFQSLLRGMSAVHAYHWSEGKEIKPWIAEHPVVRIHPTTGREGLYINRMFTTRFSNMSILESKPLLESLFNQMEAHDITCRFKWNKGDVLIWDNRFTLHYPINDFSGVRRKMIRTSILETAVQ